ncbi:MAG: type II secretion system protein [Gammaproteobacteria bacterium]|nr:type II secretion system protein [Gammaproteobacteria bacterium]MCP5135406.1 type II secretion system protein [Gammaproteobacteria bacterium]
MVISISRKQRGFTLLELMASMMVASVLLGGWYGANALSEVAEIDRQIQSVTAEQMRYIAQAAQSYTLDNAGAWPDEGNSCAGAVATLDADGYITSFISASPTGASYSTSCTTGNSGTFTVSVDAGDSTSASVIANTLPASSTSGSTVSGAWPFPAAIPALDAFLARDGSTGEMTANLDMGGNSIVNPEDVVTQTGQSLAEAVTFATEVTPGEVVTKPDCPSGTSASVWAGFRRASLPSAGAIYGMDVTVTDLGTQWQFDPVMTGAGGVEAVNSTYVRMTVIAKCS